MTTTFVPQTDRPTHPTTLDDQGTTMLLLNEALARSRQREAEQRAREHRLARRLSAGRGWARLARYCARRAERARAVPAA
jgi:putative heme iron utilization protein